MKTRLLIIIGIIIVSGSVAIFVTAEIYQNQIEYKEKVGGLKDTTSLSNQEYAASSDVERLLIQNQIEYVPSKLVVTGGPAFKGDPGCGAVIDLDSKTHWFEIDSISNPKNMKLYSENPNPCKINHTSCFCNAQMELTALTLDELSYLTSEQEHQVGKRVQKYFETTSHAISENKFVVGKYNFDMGEKYTGICGVIITESTDFTPNDIPSDGVSTHRYFSAYMDGSRLWDFSLSVDNENLCAISDDAKIFEYQKHEE